MEICHAILKVLPLGIPGVFTMSGIALELTYIQKKKRMGNPTSKHRTLVRFPYRSSRELPKKHGWSICKFGHYTPWKMNGWNTKMEVWKMIFLCKLVIVTFHLNFQGCKLLRCQYSKNPKGNWFVTADCLCMDVQHVFYRLHAPLFRAQNMGNLSPALFRPYHPGRGDFEQFERL